MASSGTGKLFTLGKNYDFNFNWSLVSQDVESNSSTISWTVSVIDLSGYGLGSNAGVTTTAKGLKVTVNGVTTSLGDVAVNCPAYNSATFASGTSTIPHRGGGAQSFTAYIDWSQFGSYYSDTSGWNQSFSSPSTKTYAGSINYIVRSAYITGYPTEWTDEDSPTITYSNPAGEYALELQACISFAGEDDIAYRDIPKTGTSYTFNFTNAEKAILWEKLYNDGYTSGMYFYIRSRVPVLNGSDYETVWDKKLTTVQLINYTPKLEPTIVEGDSDVYKLTDSNEIMVAGMSDAFINMGTEARKGATIVRQYVSNGDQQLDNASTGTLTDITSNTFYFYVEDSRGNIERGFKVYDDSHWIPYLKPTVKIKSAELTTDGRLVLNITGKYFDGNFGNATNKLAISCSVGSASGEWNPSTRVDYISPIVDEENNYSATYTFTGLDYDKRYRYVVAVADELSTSAETSGITAAEPLFDWGKEDFQFNIPVNMNKGFMYPQTLLWQGAAQMDENETITLDKPISELPTGIVLVFSLYRDGAATDASIQSFFLSRVELQYLFSGKPHMFMMGINSNLSVFGSKYLYINEDSISGFEGNTNSGNAASGITFDNSQFVLRYVIGV